MSERKFYYVDPNDCVVKDFDADGLSSTGVLDVLQVRRGIVFIRDGVWIVDLYDDIDMAEREVRRLRQEKTGWQIGDKVWYFTSDMKSELKGPNKESVIWNGAVVDINIVNHVLGIGPDVPPLGSVWGFLPITKAYHTREEAEDELQVWIVNRNTLQIYKNGEGWKWRDKDVEQNSVKYFKSEKEANEWVGEQLTWSIDRQSLELKKYDYITVGWMNKEYKDKIKDGVYDCEDVAEVWFMAEYKAREWARKEQDKRDREKENSKAWFASAPTGNMGVWAINRCVFTEKGDVLYDGWKDDRQNGTWIFYSEESARKWVNEIGIPSLSSIGYEKYSNAEMQRLNLNRQINNQFPFIYNWNWIGRLSGNDSWMNMGYDGRVVVDSNAKWWNGMTGYGRIATLKDVFPFTNIFNDQDNYCAWLWNGIDRCGRVYRDRIIEWKNDNQIRFWRVNKKTGEKWPESVSKSLSMESIRGAYHGWKMFSFEDDAMEYSEKIKGEILKNKEQKIWMPKVGDKVWVYVEKYGPCICEVTMRHSGDNGEGCYFRELGWIACLRVYPDRIACLEAELKREKERSK